MFSSHGEKIMQPQLGIPPVINAITATNNASNQTLAIFPLAEILNPTPG
jgi:hypothetical protein